MLVPLATPPALPAEIEAAPEFPPAIAPEFAVPFEEPKPTPTDPPVPTAAAVPTVPADELLLELALADELGTTTFDAVPLPLPRWLELAAATPPGANTNAVPAPAPPPPDIFWAEASDVVASIMPAAILTIVRVFIVFSFRVGGSPELASYFSSTGLMHIIGRTCPSAGVPALRDLPKEFLS